MSAPPTHPLDQLITRPTLLLDPDRARRNIERMAARARRSGVRFRPHFKTHQSARIAEWFRDAGVEHCTVSSVEMAAYFAAHGWTDITIAFPVNLREIPRIESLPGGARLGLLVEDPATVHNLGARLTRPVDIWIKIDTGYGRTGIAWHDRDRLESVAHAVAGHERLTLQGVIAHAGHTYAADDPGAVAAIHRESVARLQHVRRDLMEAGVERVIVSIGDTPGCSIVDDLSDVDEIRPGNFAFYDLMQRRVGACGNEEIAVALASPVVAKHPARSELVIYGGAVHLSKDALRLPDGRACFGQIALLESRGWSAPIDGAYVTGVSQEHGIVAAPPPLFERIAVGDLLLVLPVHSCLTADAMQGYLTLDGERIPMMPKAAA
jgi:D-serine deaminase-like pyridoxal phosphate-dependent protein